MLQVSPSKKMIRRIATGFSVSKPFSLSLETLSHQLVQRCSVSGTPKGKASAGNRMKKSKLTTKKASAKGAGGKGRPWSLNVEQIITDCLNAPTPLRHLTPKQQAREDMRVKLGLVSEETQREQNKLKKMANKRGGKEEEGAPIAIGTPGLDYISLGLVDADKIPKYELTKEDGKRLAKEYSRLCMRKTRARQAAESTLLRLKKEAIEALPKHLKAATLVPDLAPPPPNLLMATLTPPIEGHHEKVKEAARLSFSKQKRR